MAGEACPHNRRIYHEGGATRRTVMPYVTLAQGWASTSASQSKQQRRVASVMPSFGSTPGGRRRRIAPAGGPVLKCSIQGGAL